MRRSYRLDITVVMLLTLIAGCAVFQPAKVTERVGESVQSGEHFSPRQVRVLAMTCQRGTASACTLLANATLEGRVAVSVVTVDALLQRACELGDGEGCRTLVQQAEKKGVDPDLLRRWKERGCQVGDAWSCYSLATNFLAANFRLGSEVAVSSSVLDASDPKVRYMVQLLEQSCHSGLPEACSQVARLEPALRKALLEPREPRALFDLACQLGDLSACLEFGELLEQEASPESGVRAKQVYEGACRAGSLPACTRLALRLLNGSASNHSSNVLTVVADMQRAEALLQQGCRRGDGEACAILGDYRAAEEGIPGPAGANLELYRLSCAQNYAAGCSRYGRSLLVQLLSEHGDLETAQDARQALEAACGQGDGSGCYYLASLYRQGTVVHRDSEKAIELLKKSCSSRYDRACYDLGQAYLETKEADDRSAALVAFYDACQLGSSVGCLELARLVQEPGVGSPDLPMASSIFQQLCGQGVVEGCVALGTLTFQEGKRQDALPWLQLACNAGNADGCFWLGRWHLSDTTNAESSGRQFLRMGCEWGSADSCVELAQILHWKPTDMGPDEGAVVLATACRWGSASACSTLAGRYLNSAHPSAAYMGSVFLEQACDEGDRMACRQLGDLFHEGRRVKKDIPRAIAVYRESCDAGDPESCGRLGRTYCMIGKRNQGVSLLQGACEKGNRWSCDELAHRK